MPAMVVAPSLTLPVPVATMYIVARNHVHGHRIPASLDHFVDLFHKFHEFHVALEPERNLAYAPSVFHEEIVTAQRTP